MKRTYKVKADKQRIKIQKIEKNLNSVIGCIFTADTIKKCFPREDQKTFYLKKLGPYNEIRKALDKRYKKAEIYTTEGTQTADYFTIIVEKGIITAWM